MNDERIQVGNISFRFDWNWIKNKKIEIIGNQIRGMLIVLDEEGHPVKIWGYESL